MKCPKCTTNATNVDVIDCGHECEFVWDCDSKECGYSFGTYHLEEVEEE